MTNDALTRRKVRAYLEQLEEDNILLADGLLVALDMIDQLKGLNSPHETSEGEPLFDIFEPRLRVLKDIVNNSIERNKIV